MRSCSKAATRPSCSAVSSGRLAQQAGFEADAVFGDALDPADGRPQLRAMSVALEAQGDTVPRTGRDDDQRAVDAPGVRVAIGQQRGQALLLGRGRLRWPPDAQTCGNAVIRGGWPQGGLQLLNTRKALRALPPASVVMCKVTVVAC
jgi:hypothetical protein